MRQSKLFTKTLHEDPKDEISINARLLIRAGFIHKEMAGVYSYLPLGLIVLRKIEEIIRDEMNAIGGQEVLMTTLQDPEVWKRSNRWTDAGENALTGLPWFKTQLTGGGELGIANTHEEALARILANHVSSYKDLPLYAYQIQHKFRNELRAKSGLMRGREFLMKDLYSFTRTEEELENFYEIVAKAYMKIFSRVGLGEHTYRTFASGGAFSKFSDEFQTISQAGEDTIYVDEEKRIGVNKEVFTDAVLNEIGLDKQRLAMHKAIEVGNIFKLGTKYAEAEGLMYKDEKGNASPVVMGSYGIGLSRLLGAIVEIHHDDNGIIWPESVAPFQVHLIAIGKDASALKHGQEIYEKLRSVGLDVLFDDRNELSPGERFHDADLIGIPWRVVSSDRTRTKEQLEVKSRKTNEPQLLSLSSAIETFTAS